MEPLPCPTQPDSGSKHLWQLSIQAVPENVEVLELSQVAELGLSIQAVQSGRPSLHRLGEGTQTLAVKASGRPTQPTALAVTSQVQDPWRKEHNTHCISG